MTVIEELAEEMYENIGEDECTIDVQDNIIVVYLDLPNTENYVSFINIIERFLTKSKFDIEDFDIDGDYEGQIEIVYDGEEGE